MKKLLLTTICRPIGPRYGDAPSVGYELLYGQVTRAQGIFSPRATHIHFSLEYIAQNLEIPTVVLQYPSKRELIRELKKGYDYVGVSFLLALFHRMKETTALIRRHAPGSKIVLGGYGTVLNDETLAPYADYICREEGVGFFRRLLGEPELAMPYDHPLIVSRLRILSVPVSRTGMIFAGLGCPNGCDFCATSYFFKRKHIRLLPTGKDIFDVIRRYLEVDPAMQFTILDEDFLLNRKRALEFRDAVQADGRPLSIFVFSSVRAISQYAVQEILEMGIDGFWIGYEGTRSGFAKQQGRPIAELFREFREHGIMILASMIVGFDYQTEEIVSQELDGLMMLKPTLAQFLIYGPTPGTPFYERIMAQNLLHRDLAENPEAYYRKCDGFAAMVNHPTLTPAQIEKLQRWCFEQDFKRLGPSVFRTVETWFLGYQKLKGSPHPYLRAKAERYAREIRKAYPLFGVGVLFGPSLSVRAWIRRLEKDIHNACGAPTWKERLLSMLAFPAAAWTALCLRWDFFQHPRLQRHAYRMSRKSLIPIHLRSYPWAARVEAFLKVRIRALPHPDWTRVHLSGTLTAFSTAQLSRRIRHFLKSQERRVVLNFQHFDHVDGAGLRVLQQRLGRYAQRIRIMADPTAQASLRDILQAYLPSFQFFADS